MGNGQQDKKARPRPTAGNYGPGNPHPLSLLQTEIVWEGKYDEYGNRREVSLAGLSMPLQRIETVDEPRSRVEAQGGLFDSAIAHKDDFRNMLIWGDNKLVMASLLSRLKGKFDLIYIDPPFDLGADFTMTIPVGDADDTLEKDQSALEMVAYRDTWGKGTDSYLHMLYERLVLIRDLLSERGSLFVHVGWQVSALVKCLLDEVFGVANLRNEIIWQRFNFHADAKRFGTVHETIWYYVKGEGAPFRKNYLPVSDSLVRSHYTGRDPDGRVYTLDNPTAPSHGRPAKSMRFGDKVIAPPAGAMWRWTQENIDRLWSGGKVVFNDSGMPRVKRYLDEVEGTAVHSLWTDIRAINSQAVERVDYATQKPEALLRRILESSSNPDSLVGDVFCGSGTTGVVAEKLGRRWVMADLGRYAIHTSRKRLIGLQRELNEKSQSYRAFDVLNLGRYERQWWQNERLQGADAEHRRVVLEFYRAEVVANSPSPLLHGRKGNAWCHVDSIDGVLARDKLLAVVQAAHEAGATEITCLAWEFEMDLRLICNALELEYGIHIKLIQIPREIMEKNRKEPPPFLEVALLLAEPILRKAGGKRGVDIKLTQFLPSLAEVPSRELAVIQERAMRSGFDFIDFWAVDFDYRSGQPFNHHWQDYRSRKTRKLRTVSEQFYCYPRPGRFTACVKVIDVFGSDTSVTVPVDYD